MRWVVGAAILLSGGCSILTDLSGYSSGAPSAPGVDAGADGPVDASVDAPTDAARSSYALVVLADQPIAYYPLDEAGGSTVSSSVQGAPIGRFTRGVTLGTPSPVGRAPGNRAATFDGASTESDLSFGDAFAFPGKAPFSVEAWVKVTSPDSQYRHVFSRSDRIGNDPSNGWNVVVQGSSPPVAWIERFVGVGTQLNSVMTPITPNTFTHLVTVYDGASLQIYVDAVAGGAPFADTRMNVAPKTAAFLGTANGVDSGHAFIGVIDEVAIYDKALSAAQVRTHYEAGKP